MSSFNYEQSIWGQGTATLKWTDPASFRLKQAILALRDLPQSAKILEVGCGAGQFIRAIKQMRSKFICHGCDISQSAIDRAKSSNDSVNYDLSNIMKFPYDDDKFDAVLVFDVLEHAKNADAILLEVKRVLKTDGLFYCFVPCEGDSLSLWNMLRKKGKYVYLTKKYAGHINYFSRKNLLELLEKHSFKIERIKYSEHALGQLLGVATFIMMEKTAIKQGDNQINNEEFFYRFNKKQSRLFHLFKSAVNFLINIESYFLSWLPSPNISVILKK